KDDVITELHWERIAQPVATVQKDRWHGHPDFDLQYRAETEPPVGYGEWFESTGRYQDHQSGELFTRYRRDRLVIESQHGVAKSNSIQLMPGRRFDLTGHPIEARNDYYQVVSVRHHGQVPEARNGNAADSGTTFYNHLHLVNGFDTWRAPFCHKPLADGDEVATVVGPPGEEIFVNEHGEIKVHFHWNRYDKPDDRASCWVRVAQAWNGSAYGFMAIPRIGQEVIISYLNGDIDRPIVTGCTYNALNDPPLNLPAEKTRTTLRTQTHKGEGFNELRFEDAKQNEQIYMHAQRDHVTEILHDQFHTIGNNRSKSVGVDQKETIGRDKRTEVGRDHYETINRNAVLKVLQHQEIQVEQNRTLVVNSSERKTIYADSIDDIGGNKTIEIQGVKDEKVNTKVFSRSKVYILHGEDKAVLAGPGGSLTIDSSGVTINAKKLTLLAPTIDIRGGGSHQVEALMATVKAGKPFCEVCAKAKKDLDDAE
ncbi:type VI secretion system tip protein TssI/VgrG, partial [Serratia microhaemolytica]|uniref:type VI secretion system tip protein TssI/VgrG n=1 Tax=Serratia microhaemolytica TaxID=2675110 RepID=UPI000FDEA194